MPRPVEIAKLMETSGVKFGTSGARGLVADMSDEVCYAYTRAFLQTLGSLGEAARPAPVALAGDLRPSTERILGAVHRAVLDAGCQSIHCGTIPTPAVALFGIHHSIPAIMVTGSHIPEDRNGIKFHLSTGEILKRDEARIKAQTVTLPDLFQTNGAFLSGARPSLPAVEPRARALYRARWLEAFPPGLLRGRRIGVYQHSAVGRELLVEILTELGAEVVPLGWSDEFVPVDTEAIRPLDLELALRWTAEHRLFALVSTDGDSDRPLVADETGKWLRGDVAGILAAKFLGADVVVTPVSCNTAVEKCGWFERVVRTRIGSPYLILELETAVAAGGRCVVGYEANGGFLTASPIPLGRGTLSRLPTRDPVIVILSVLGLAIQQGLPVSALGSALPARFTASDRLVDFPTERSQKTLEELRRGGPPRIEAVFGRLFGKVLSIDETDGLRITFKQDEVLHLRPSGNAPELRCYTEAQSEARAWAMNQQAIDLMQGWRS
jgi:phosphomannomutase